MASTKLRVLISDVLDPWFNLATEDWIFRDMDLNHHTLFLWRNQPTVVIGRSQNPWVECNLQNMETDNILLARRQTGGGAVFHDLGNTNFTFLAGKTNYDKTINSTIVINALKNFAINAELSGRNDIIINTQEGAKKISGSAYRETKDRAFHHGTLLINVNLERLQQYLNPNKKKLQAKGVSSVRSRVANLVEFNELITHEILCGEIIRAFFAYYQTDCAIEFLNYADLQTVPQLQNYYGVLKDWQWRFGQTLAFNHQLEQRFDWGSIDIRLDVDHGVIHQAQIFSDSLYPEMIEKLTSELKGRRYHIDDIQLVLVTIKQQIPNLTVEINQLTTWLLKELS